jgi:maltooligosyltrehalose trehalohydrolase
LAEPLLAPPDRHRWAVAWSSEHPRYGGEGRRPLDPDQFFILPGNCTVVLRSEARP